MPNDELPARVGLTVQFRTGRRAREGVVLHARRAGVEVAVDGECFTVSIGRLHVTAGESLSPVVRLWNAAARRRDSLVSLRLNEALLSMANRRALAAAGVLNGDEAAIGAAGLSACETDWLLMWARHNHGDGPGALRKAAALPIAGYPDKVAVIAAWWSETSADPALRAELSQHVSTSNDPLARVVRLVLGDLVTVADGVGDGSGVQFDPAALADFEDRVAQVRANGSVTPDVTVVGLTPCDLERLPLPVVDELIDRGLVTPEWVMDLDGERGQYLRCRVAPEFLTQEELRELGHQDELARRAYIAGGRLDGFADSEDVRRLRLLEGLRNGDTKVLGELAPLLAHETLSVALAVGASLRDGLVDPKAVADRSTWRVLAQLVPDGPARTEAPPSIRGLAEWCDLEESKRALYDWEWQRSAQHARECLRTAVDEGVRDEALNTLACALLHQGDADGATRALREAIAGVDSPELIINYGIAAAEHDRIDAAEELARLALEAPTLDLRVTAAMRALTLWGTRLHADDTGDDDSPGDDDEPPRELIHALRTLAVEPTSLERHIEILRFLYWADGEWLTNPRHTVASPHSETPAHKYLIAKAKGNSDGVNKLAELLKANPDDPWLVGERDEFVAFLIGFMFKETTSFGVGLCALEVADSGLAPTSSDNMLLQILGVREIAFACWADEDNEGVLKREFLDRLVTARSVIDGDPELDNDLYIPLIGAAVRGLAGANFHGWKDEIDMVAAAHDQIVDRLQGLRRRQVNTSAVRQMTQPMLTVLGESESYIYDVRQNLGTEADEAREGLDALRSYLTEVRRAINALPG